MCAYSHAALLGMPLGCRAQVRYSNGLIQVKTRHWWQQEEPALQVVVLNNGDR